MGLILWYEKQILDLGIKEINRATSEAVSLALDYIDAGNAHCLGEVEATLSSRRGNLDRANDLLLEILKMASLSKTSVQLTLRKTKRQHMMI